MAVTSEVIAAVAQRMRVDHWTAEVATAFSAGGIRFILLKGPSTLTWLYPDDPHRRTYNDVDLLVAPGDGSAAGRILSELGFMPSPAPRLAADGHHARSYIRGGELATVDLHHTLHGMRDVPGDRLWEAAGRDAQRMTVAGARVAVLGGPMRLLHVALHLGARQGPDDQAWIDLTRALDVSTVGDWEAAIAVARELGVVHELAARLRRRPDAAWLLDRLGSVAPATRYNLVAAVDGGRAPAAVLSIDHLVSAGSMGKRARYTAGKVAVPSADLAPPAARVLALTRSLTLARAAHAATLAGRLPAALAAWRRERADRELNSVAPPP